MSTNTFRNCCTVSRRQSLGSARILHAGRPIDARRHAHRPTWRLSTPPCSACTARDRLAIDTEFMRESTYYPQLCLVQVATETDCFLVDPLAGLDLGAAARAARRAHAGSRSCTPRARTSRCCCSQAARVPGPVFDTQIAAALLGFAPQIGYAELVARRLGHSIDKGQTRTDWSRRPLTPEQLAYAADDVHHLLTCTRTSRAGARRAGPRATGWTRKRRRSQNPDAVSHRRPPTAWRRLKGFARLHRRSSAAAARRSRSGASSARSTRDKPRGWILADEALFAIATLRPQRLDALEQHSGAAARPSCASAARNCWRSCVTHGPPARRRPEQRGDRRPPPQETAHVPRVLMQTGPRRGDATRHQRRSARDAARRRGAGVSLGRTRRRVRCCAAGGAR